MNQQDIELGTDWIPDDLVVLRWHDGESPSVTVLPATPSVPESRIENPGYPSGWRWSKNDSDGVPWIVIDIVDGGYRVSIPDYSSVAVGDGLLDKKTHGSFDAAYDDFLDRATKWLANG